MKEPEFSKVAAKVAARNGLDEVGDGWKSEVTEETIGERKIFIPTIFHHTNRIGVRFVVGHGWRASVGLKTEFQSSSLLLKAHSDLNVSARRAAIEVVGRASALVEGLKVPFEQLDTINRTLQRREDPSLDIPNVPTFESWWATVESSVPADAKAAMRDIALAAWNAKQ